MTNSKIICLCRTYYQLIFVIRLKNTVLQNDEISVIMTDEMNSAVETAGRLRETGIFSDVYYKEGIREKTASFNRLSNKIKRFVQYFVTGDYTAFLKGKKFDRFLFFNLSWYTYLLFHTLWKANPDIAAAKYEEGLISYYVSDHANDAPYYQRIWKIKKRIRQPVIFDRLKDFYCFYPEIYPGSLHPVRVPPITRKDQELIREIAYIFRIEPEELVYSRKYIYFASRLDDETDAGKDMELKLAGEIADIVGRENLLVKLHPRETDARKYVRADLTIDENGDRPFEIIQIVHDFSENVFITALSGSVINFSAATENAPEIFFAYNACETNGEHMRTVVPLYERLIADLREKMNLHRIYVFRDKNDMRARLLQDGK